MALSKPWFAKTVLYFVVTSLIVGASNEEEPKFESLPFCNDKISQDKKLVLISTLDGKMSALNVENGGAVSWSLPTGPGPMLSSSIHRLELTSNGHWVRMIPSLSGHLYKFDGESIEAVPVNANQLLRNSFRYSEDLVISGGRETRTYGVDILSGRVLYECTMRGCDNFTEEMTEGHVLVLQRETQTIRAVEPRTGSERWNYSVAQHDVKLMQDPSADCHDRGGQSDIQIKVIVPEGLVCALSRSEPSKVLWKQKFDFPVVHAWQYNRGKIESLDLFSGSMMPPNSRLAHPSLYIGMHQKQLYIQESVTVQQAVAEESRLALTGPAIPRIPWKPFPATGNAGKICWPQGSDLPQISSDENSDSTTALSVLYASEYVNGNGFYLFSPEEETPEETPEISYDNETLHEEEEAFPYSDEDETPVQIIIVSLWYWWKEVLIISITTALLFNLFFTQRFLYLLQRQDVSPQHILVVKQGSDSGLDVRRYSGPDDPCSSNFSSRYLDDFEQVRCLGRGGFGVVFEARKKIDDCSYAVKRIALPNRKESRERVMREVKALAKLEHPHIVRYYHSWLECPPPGWQEKQDGAWIRELQSKDSMLGDCSLEDSTTTHNNQLLPYFKRDSEVTLNIPSEENSAPAPTELSDSFIQFRDSSREVTPSPNKTVGTYVPISGESSESSEEESMAVSSEDESPRRTSPMFLYIQMQLCRKESLREWLQRRNGERTNEALHVFHQITQAVEYVHQQGLIHRDLKPSNIFFSMDGHIKVGDFGLVTDSLVPQEEGQRTPREERKPWAVSQETGERRHTANVGTKLYMSPEQMHGLPYDHKVDIYSLGVILFELLWPFSTQMERADALQALREKLFPPSFQQTFSTEWSLLVLMLSHAPEERPTAQEIRVRLPQVAHACA